MYVTKKTDGSIFSKNRTFIKGVKERVDKEVFDYLNKTFPNEFIFDKDVQVTKKAPVTKPKQEKAKVPAKDK